MLFLMLFLMRSFDSLSCSFCVYSWADATAHEPWRVPKRWTGKTTAMRGGALFYTTMMILQKKIMILPLKIMTFVAGRDGLHRYAVKSIGLNNHRESK